MKLKLSKFLFTFFLATAVQANSFLICQSDSECSLKHVETCCSHDFSAIYIGKSSKPRYQYIKQKKYCDRIKCLPGGLDKFALGVKCKQGKCQVQTHPIIHKNCNQVKGNQTACYAHFAVKEKNIDICHFLKKDQNRRRCHNFFLKQNKSKAD